MGQSLKFTWMPAINKEDGPPTSHERRFKSFFFEAFPI